MTHILMTKYIYCFSALFVTLYTAIERLLSCADEADSSTSESVLSRCVLLRDLCPALHGIMADGLKPEVITSFGRMPTSVWRVVEAVTRQVYNSLFCNVTSNHFIMNPLRFMSYCVLD